MGVRSGGIATSVCPIPAWTCKRSMKTWPEPTAIKKEEATFCDIQAFILSLEPPKYPFSIDSELALKGEGVFRATCSRCHGTYGQDWTYPNKIVAMDIIDTDRNRFEGFKPES